MMVLLAMLLTAVAGVVAPADPNAVEAAYRPRRVALIVGVQDYNDPELQGLRYPEADAKGIYQVLHRPDVGGFDDAIVLVGHQNTTKRAIQEAIAWATAELQRDDTFLLYFSGHGTLSFDLVAGSQLFFLPSDARLAEPEKTGISVAWLEDVVSSLPSRRRVLILDTCHNGRSGKSAVNSSTAQLLSAMRGPPPEPRGLRDVSESEARLYAAQYYQPALEDAHLGNGVYTHFLIEALTSARSDADLDGDGLINIAELHEYARDHTMNYTSGVQVPRAEYRLVGHDEIYLAGDPSLRGMAERALLSACDEILAKARLLVDGVPRGTLPGVTPIDPGRHNVKVTTPAGDTLVNRSVKFDAGSTVPVEGLLEEAKGRWALLGGYGIRNGPAADQHELPGLAELELIRTQPFTTPYWFVPSAQVRVGYGRGQFPDAKEPGLGSSLELSGGLTLGARMGPVIVGPMADVGVRGRLEVPGETGQDRQGGATYAVGGSAMAIWSGASPDMVFRYDFRTSWASYGDEAEANHLFQHGIAIGAMF
jgi:uncharacterized caspase-like protein